MGSLRGLTYRSYPRLMPNRITAGKVLLTADANGDSKKAAVEPPPLGRSWLVVAPA